MGLRRAKRLKHIKSRANVVKEGKEDVLINLPPECCPCVAFLANVPHLQHALSETHYTLKNKEVYWLAKNCGYPVAEASQVLSTRRVSWIGPLHKSLRGDCIIINFSTPGWAGFTLDRAPRPLQFD